MDHTSSKKGIVYLTLAQMVMMATGFLIHFWVGRYLGPKEYGIYGVVLALMGVFNLFLVFGVPRSLSKYLPQNKGAEYSVLQKGLQIQVIFGFILGIIYFLLAPYIAFLLNDETLTPYLRFSALVAPIYAIFSVYSGYFNGLRFFGVQSFLTIFYSLIKVVSAISLIYIFKIYGAIAGFIIAPLLTFFLASAISFRQKKGAQKVFFPAKKLVSFAVPFIGLAIFLYLERELGLLLIKSFLKDSVVAGYYNAANTIAKIPYAFLEALALFSLPVITKVFTSEGIEKTKDVAERIMSFLIIVLMPGIFLAYFTREEVINFLYGKVYLEGSFILPVLVLSFSILAIFFVLANIFAAIKSALAPFKISLLMLALNFAFSIYFIPREGMAGAAYSTLLSVVLGTLVILVVIFKEIGFIIKWRFVLKILIIAFTATFIAYFLVLPKWLLPLEYAIILLFYGLLLWFFKEIRKEDILVLKQIILFKKD